MPTQAEAELAHALLGAGQLRGRMRQEVEAFINGYPGIAPDAEVFAERLVEALLVGGASGSHDARAAAEIYGDFANAFAAHSWSEPRLARWAHGHPLRRGGGVVVWRQLWRGKATARGGRRPPWF